MGSFTELKNLKHEEQALLKIESLINDQLNRLKVEELALMNQIRSQEESENDDDETGKTIIEMENENSDIEFSQNIPLDDDDVNKQPLIDLVKTVLVADDGADMEEEEDSDEEEQDDLTRFVKQIQG